MYQSMAPPSRLTNLFSICEYKNCSASDFDMFHGPSEAVAPVVSVALAVSWL
jgi:hypothetical protein